MQDKAIRAVFISVFLYLIGNYQQYLTVLRFHPEPRFFFDVKEYKAKFTEGELDEAWSSFLKSVHDQFIYVYMYSCMINGVCTMGVCNAQECIITHSCCTYFWDSNCIIIPLVL